MLPGDKSLLSLPLDIVPLLLVIIIILEAAVFPSGVRPVVVVLVVVVLTLSGPGPRPRSGSGAASSGTSNADSPDVSRLFEPTLALFSLPLSVAWLREFGPEAVRREAPIPAVPAAVSSSSPRTARFATAVRARTIRQRHTVRTLRTYRRRETNQLEL